jgi:hypothetical protein
MANVNATFRGRAVVEAASVAKVYNVSLPTANTEVGQALTDGTKQITVKNRTNGITKFTFVSGESATKYVTIPRGAVYKEENLNTSSATIYMQSPQASQTIEVLEWS